MEERIKQLTCGIDEENDESTQENGDDDNSKIEDTTDLSHRDSPAGEENPQKFNANANNSDKSFSPNSSVSSSSSSSSAYKKITEIFNREKKNQEKIMEMEENPIVIIPQVANRFFYNNQIIIYQHLFFCCTKSFVGMSLSCGA